MSPPRDRSRATKAGSREDRVQRPARATIFYKIEGSDDRFEIEVPRGAIIAVIPAPPSAATDGDTFRSDAQFAAQLADFGIAQENLKQSGGVYNLAQVRRLLNGLSRQTVEKRVREGSMLAVPGPNNRRLFPAIQFDGEGMVVAGLDQVQHALVTNDPWAVLHFLVTSNSLLEDERPIDLMKKGRLPLVVQAARRYGVKAT